MNENIDFIKQYAPKISTDAEEYSNQTSHEYKKKYAATTKNLMHINKLLDHDDPDIRHVAAGNPNATEEHLDKALNDFSVDVRWAAARNPNCTKEHLDKALNDFSIDGWFVREAAAGNPSCNKENIDKALVDKDPVVREEAMDNPRYIEYYPNGHQK